MAKSQVHRSCRLHGISPIEEEPYPSRRRLTFTTEGPCILDKESVSVHSDHVDVEVVEEGTVPPSNPPLTDPFGPVLIEVAPGISEPLSVLHHRPIM